MHCADMLSAQCNEHIKALHVLESDCDYMPICLIDIICYAKSVCLLKRRKYISSRTCTVTDARTEVDTGVRFLPASVSIRPLLFRFQLIKCPRRPREGGLRRGENFWLHLTTASAQCLHLI